VTDSNNESEEDDNETSNAEVDVGDDDNFGTGNITTEEEGGGDSTDVKHVEDAYRTTKAMGDADRQVRLKFLVR
jgi:hypothetical protein